jgi:drug/metabolite transporter (DMT)-like permease
MTFILIIFQTNPLWSAILGYIFNRERVNSVELIAMLSSFVCIILIAMARSAKSSTETSSDETQETSATDTSSQNALWLGVILCLCHAWLFSASGVISRKLQHIHFAELMLHQSVQGVLIAAVILVGQAVFAHENPLGELSGKQAGILLGGCICDSAAVMSVCIAF